MPTGRRAGISASRSARACGARSTRAYRSRAPMSGGVGLRLRGGLARRLAVQLELVGALLERGDDEPQVLVEVEAERLGALADLVAVDRRREGRRLELLLDRLGRHAVDALGADVGAGHDEPGQLVDRVQG